MCSNQTKKEFVVLSSKTKSIWNKALFCGYHPNASMLNTSVISSWLDGTCSTFKNLNRPAIFLHVFFFPQHDVFFYTVICLHIHYELIMKCFVMLFDICYLVYLPFVIIQCSTYGSFGHLLICNTNGIRIFNGIKKAIVGEKKKCITAK